MKILGPRLGCKAVGRVPSSGLEPQRPQELDLASQVNLGLTHPTKAAIQPTVDVTVTAVGVGVETARYGTRGQLAAQAGERK